MKQIPLTQDKFAIVDDWNFEWLNQWKWCAIKVKGVHWYAVRTIKHRQILMHRLIMGLKFGDKREIDHIDHIGLNNKQCNLRICTHSQNLQNRKARGAYKRTDRKGWTSQIRVNGKTIYLGDFKTEKEATKAYQKATKKYFGEFAYVA